MVETEPGAKCRPPAHANLFHTTLAAPAGDCYLGVVASSGPSGPHHAGLVVDPLVREDGQSGPEFRPNGLEQPHSGGSLDAQVTVNPRETPEGPAAEAIGDDGDIPAGVHPVRARLLAKAAARDRPGRALSGLAELEPSVDQAERALDVELDLVAAPSSRAPSAPVTRQWRGHLTPNMVWLAGTLLGLVTVVTLVALGIKLDPHPGSLSASAFGMGASASVALQPTSASAVLMPSPRRARVKLPGPWRIQDAERDATVRILTGTIGRQAFLRAIEEAGVPKKESYRVFSTLKSLLDLDKCDRHDRFAALIQRADGRVKAFEYIISKEEVYQVRDGSDGVAHAQKLDLKVIREQVKGSIVMDGDFARSVERGGFDSSLSRVMAQALNGHMSVSEIDRGDMVRVIAQEVTVLGDFARYAGIEALEVRPADGNKKGLRVYYFRGSKSRGYFDATGHSPYEGGWRKPIPGAPVTSQFNLKRFHPVLKRIMPHLGMDFGAPAGAPVGASSYGTVSFMGYAGPAGNLVRVQHPDGVETGYAHLQRFADGLTLGDQVKRLEVIGYVGSTGRSTGPHLHFMAKKEGKYFDPMDLKLDAMRVLPEEERAAFAESKASYDRMLDAITWPAQLPVEAGPTASAAPPASELDGESIGMDVASSPSLPPSTPSSVLGGAPAPERPAGSARPPRSKAVYLTDKELLESQPLHDDGESEE